MTSKFDDELTSTNKAFLNAFGTNAFIRGVQIEVIFESEQFDDETGRIYQTSMMVDWSDVKHIKSNDSVLINDSTYKVKRMPEKNTDEPLAIIELKRA